MIGYVGREIFRIKSRPKDNSHWHQSGQIDLSLSTLFVSVEHEKQKNEYALETNEEHFSVNTERIVSAYIVCDCTKAHKDLN